MVGYGVPVTLFAPGERWSPSIDEEQRFRADPNGAAATVPDLDIVRGTLMDQCAQADGVYGLDVTRALFGDVMPIPVDVAAAAHADRVRSLGDLSARSTYHLIANHD